MEWQLIGLFKMKYKDVEKALKHRQKKSKTNIERNNANFEKAYLHILKALCELGLDFIKTDHHQRLRGKVTL